MICNLDLMPGHKTKFSELFSKKDKMYSKQSVQRMIESALETGFE